ADEQAPGRGAFGEAVGKVVFQETGAEPDQARFDALRLVKADRIVQVANERGLAGQSAGWGSLEPRIRPYWCFHFHASRGDLGSRRKLDRYVVVGASVYLLQAVAARLYLNMKELGIFKDLQLGGGSGVWQVERFGHFAEGMGTVGQQLQDTP